MCKGVVNVTKQQTAKVLTLEDSIPYYAKWIRIRVQGESCDTLIGNRTKIQPGKGWNRVENRTPVIAFLTRHLGFKSLGPSEDSKILAQLVKGSIKVSFEKMTYLDSTYSIYLEYI